ncbi:hypothetical protein EZS27_011689 [termite gut metagenome]|uniref:Uncharacterized protein n=1 Tax=termite gut metagenome TaxID=433724 RepID=A0A5J4S5D2_9ZZZZ
MNRYKTISYGKDRKSNQRKSEIGAKQTFGWANQPLLGVLLG